ncbi:ImpB/MucB/SamB family protein [Streptomyces sp. NPDC005840]|uniref:ImpB/MucB/SamB family protein n=1 Tax=Streptomyces doudnae TaxID=3075536 RepID=A0ABD5EUB0_9ACTN|nr:MULTISPECIES: ImpB/MucB/SamB family protein [unclassified Streptomyces]MDT0437579.1 ImpB/MucB/SamB family protein [Streptomyces sp. DSM 41981]MYQ67107.1 ImpB/MucB/SamB family protein [Streptomyces sp. SID4950]SCE30057.1 DNA polymerase-4 [Streptomyces sp. SolWspMP-5a-2]
MSTRQRHIAHLHLHAPPGEEQYADIIELMSGITPHVQAVPPDAVQLDLTSALRYFGLSPYDVVQLAKMRLKALYGVDSSAGLAGNRMLAAMAADASAPGETTWVRDGQAADWLHPRPVTALPGVGRVTADTLDRYGLRTIGQLTDLPAGTLQRLLGAGSARLLAERARGHDPRPVTPSEPAAHLVADLALDRDCLDPDRHHRAVLGLADRIGRRLREDGRIASRITLTVRYADRSSTTRTCALPEATAHSPDLAAAALGLLAGLGLQRARVRAFVVRADGLLPAGLAHRQLSLDPGADRARAVESAADRARRRFGPRAVHPAALAD